MPQRLLPVSLPWQHGLGTVLGDPGIAPGVSPAVGTPSPRGNALSPALGVLLWQIANTGCWALAVQPRISRVCWMSALNFKVLNASLKECD